MGAGPGRPKGCPNKITKDFRATVQKVLEDNAENVGKWLMQVAEGVDGEDGDPAKALDLIAKLAEFGAPKLARTETVMSGTLELTNKEQRDAAVAAATRADR